MPRLSVKTQLFKELEHVAQTLLEHHAKNNSSSSDDSDDSDLSIFPFTPISSITPTLTLSGSENESDSDDDNNATTVVQLLLRRIEAHTEEAKQTRYFNIPAVPLMKDALSDGSLEEKQGRWSGVE
ncbi:hypothetical protein PAXRUDRAFT_19511 [Paxillus rubicundulus Ve08.2h10]|uniref:Unplaced genomic scaffold scaffold_3717, whole genome shotgun sequence n=1 Tax=Paxillus rubicundulus Ve08.2h10 TaxID=930991 RepID=A0A0D0CUN6_9AGAM|nr:hypothetical protein PAXRUDRAFT_19511 [Paxillus rubicundulus Ve08.2h10]